MESLTERRQEEEVMLDTRQSPLLRYDGKESHSPLWTLTPGLFHRKHLQESRCTATHWRLCYSILQLCLPGLPVSHRLHLPGLSALTLLISTAIPFISAIVSLSLTMLVFSYNGDRPGNLLLFQLPSFPSQTWISVFCLLYFPSFQAFGFGT